MLKICALLGAAALATAGDAAVTFQFPAGDSVEHTAAFDGTVDQANAEGYGIFTAGDYIEDYAFVPTATTFSSYDFSAPVINYALSESERFSILLNGALIGAFTIDPQTASNGTVSGSASFAPVTVSGATTLRVLLTNTVTPGNGSVGAGTTGSFTLSSAVPEPMSWATMTIGFAMVGCGLRQRRRRVAAA